MSYTLSQPKFFMGGKSGQWAVKKFLTICGEELTPVDRVYVGDSSGSGTWVLKGVASHVRYVERPEKMALEKLHAPLGRKDSTTAVLIPISKSANWWELTQEERRAIMEDQSKHISYSLKYLPAIARQLYHSRDLGEPFDFLTWFEFHPNHDRDFCELVTYLRGTPEWQFVTRESEIWLTASLD